LIDFLKKISYFDGLPDVGLFVSTAEQTESSHTGCPLFLKKD